MLRSRRDGRKKEWKCSLLNNHTYQNRYAATLYLSIHWGEEEDPSNPDVSRLVTRGDPTLRQMLHYASPVPNAHSPLRQFLTRVHVLQNQRIQFVEVHRGRLIVCGGEHRAG